MAKKVMLQTENVKVVYETPDYGYIGLLQIYHRINDKWSKRGKIAYSKNIGIVYASSGPINSKGSSFCDRSYEKLVERINYWHENLEDEYHVPMTKAMFDEWEASLLMDRMVNY